LTERDISAVGELLSGLLAKFANC